MEELKTLEKTVCDFFESLRNDILSQNPTEQLLARNNELENQNKVLRERIAQLEIYADGWRKQAFIDHALSSAYSIKYKAGNDIEVIKNSKIFKTEIERWNINNPLTPITSISTIERELLDYVFKKSKNN